MFTRKKEYLEHTKIAVGLFWSGFRKICLVEFHRSKSPFFYFQTIFQHNFRIFLSRLIILVLQLGLSKSFAENQNLKTRNVSHILFSTTTSVTSSLSCNLQLNS